MSDDLLSSNPFRNLLRKQLLPKIEGEDIYNKQRVWFYSFLKNTTQKKEFIKALKERSEQLGLVSDTNTKVLDVGTGNGASLIPVLEDIMYSGIPWDKKSFTEVHIDESNLGVMLDFVINYCIDGYRFMSLNLNNDYDKEGFFDLVTASHVFYYTPDWPETLSRLLRTLKPNGKMVIAQTSEQGFMYKFRKEFFPKVGVKELGECMPHSGEELFETLSELVNNPKESFVKNAIESLVNPDMFEETRGYEDELIKAFMMQDLKRKGQPVGLINELLKSKFGSSNIVLPNEDELSFKQELIDEYTGILEKLITVDDFTNPSPINIEKFIISSETLLNKDNFNNVLSFMLRTDFSKLKPELQKEVLNYVGRNSTVREGGYVLPFRDLGIILNKESMYEYISIGTPFDLMDCVDITTRHVSAFLLKFLEKELGNNLIEEGRQRTRNYLKNKRLNDNDLRTLGILGHTKSGARFEFLRTKGFIEKDLSDYNDYMVMNSFSINYERLLYYDFVLLDLFLSNPYHAGVVCTFSKTLNTGHSARALPSLMQALTYYDEFLESKTMPSINERREAFINCFESMYLLNKNYDYSLKKTLGEYVINECVRVDKPVKPFNELLMDYQRLYKKYGHDKIVIPPGSNSLAANEDFSKAQVRQGREELIIERFAKHMRFFNAVR